MKFEQKKMLGECLDDACSALPAAYLAYSVHTLHCVSLPGPYLHNTTAKYNTHGYKPIIGMLCVAFT